jgi:endonuclease/exonuclease/phosphatase family metal-dependent hydrolase
MNRHCSRLLVSWTALVQGCFLGTPLSLLQFQHSEGEKMNSHILGFAAGLAFFLCSAVSAQPPVLRVMTYNIHHCEGTDGKIDIERIAGIIRKSGCDLVALQEVDRGTVRCNKVDQLAELARLTNLHPYFGKAIDFGGGEYGVAILSRFPAVSQRTVKLPSSPQREQRVALHIVVQPESLPALEFVCTHLDHSSGENDRKQQNAELVKQFGATERPVILAGDFNSTIDRPELAAILELWQDVDAQKLTPTIPTHKPTRKIDFIFLPIKTSWSVEAAKVLDEPVASDHLPLHATVKLQ